MQPICSVILALRVDIVKPGAYSIPLIAVIECTSILTCATHGLLS